MTNEELAVVLSDHLKWLSDPKTGKRADLSSAILRFAGLHSANLQSANLWLANLYGANLRTANLRSANLRSANLSLADLRSADLRAANLECATLEAANLESADLRAANLKSANLRSADLMFANLQGATLPQGVPRIEKLDSAILHKLETGGALNMAAWHSCDTTHCRAGWAVILAGDDGNRLERLLGSAAAGALIYAASRPNKPIPDFLATRVKALADIKACAAEES